MAALILSILFFYGFVILYNSVCITCFGIENPFWVIYETFDSPEYWLTSLLVSVVALLPRYVVVFQCNPYFLYLVLPNFFLFIANFKIQIPKLRKIKSFKNLSEKVYAYFIKYQHNEILKKIIKIFRNHQNHQTFMHFCVFSGYVSE